MDQIDIDGLRIAYERAGRGPPLVLLHGYVGDGRSTWRHQIDEFSADYTVVAWDAPGAGASSDPPESFGMTGYADCLAAFVTALDLREAHVVGLSFGGAVALALHGRHPTIARTLALASAYAGWYGSLPRDSAELRLEQAVRLSQLSPDEFVQTLLPTMFTAPPAPEDIEAFESAMRNFHPAGFREQARAAAEDVRDVLPRVQVPTLLIYGGRDERAPLAVAEDLHSSIATSRLVVLPGVGHVCNIEASHEFNRALRGFLDECR